MYHTNQVATTPRSFHVRFSSQQDHASIAEGLAYWEWLLSIVFPGQVELAEQPEMENGGSVQAYQLYADATFWSAFNGRVSSVMRDGERVYSNLAGRQDPAMQAHLVPA